MVLLRLFYAGVRIFFFESFLMQMQDYLQFKKKRHRNLAAIVAMLPHDPKPVAELSVYWLLPQFFSTPRRAFMKYVAVRIQLPAMLLKCPRAAIAELTFCKRSSAIQNHSSVMRRILLRNRQL
jgi:hypothetical protein